MLRSAGLGYRFLIEELGIWLPRVRVECEFHLPARLDELLAVDACFSRIGRTSVHLKFDVYRGAAPQDPGRARAAGEERVASGKYVLVCVTQGDFKPVPVPAALRERVAPYLDSSGDG